MGKKENKMEEKFFEARKSEKAPPRGSLFFYKKNSKRGPFGVFGGGGGLGFSNFKRNWEALGGKK